MNKLYIIFCFLYCFEASSQDTLFLSVNNLLELHEDNSLVIKKNNLKDNISKVDLFNSSVGDLLPNINIGLRTYELNGYTQSVDGDIFNVDRNNQFKGLAIQAKWDLGDLIFNFMGSKENNRVSLFTTKLANIKELVQIYELAYDLLGSQAKENAIQDFIIKNNKIINQLEIQYNAGISLESNLLLTKSNLNNLKIKLLKQKNKTYSLIQNIIALVGLSDTSHLVLTNSLYQNINYPVSNFDINSLIENRYDLRIKNHMIKSAKNEKNKVLFSLLLPTIELGYNDGLFGFVNTEPFGNQNIFTKSLMWKIPISHIIPYGHINQKKSLLHIRVLEKEQLQYDIKSRINIVFRNLNSANTEYLLSEESFLFTKRAYEQCLQRQELGTSTQLELFYAEKEYLNANLIYVDAIVNKHICSFLTRVEIEDKIY